MSSKKIIVVTPVLCPSQNVLNTIEKCFYSIRKAVDKVNAKWIVVDDGSLVGQDFFEKIADVYLKNKKTIGVSYSLNRGMKIKQDVDFLVKLDSDYLVPENLFEVLLTDWSEDLAFIAPSFQYSRPTEESSYDINTLPHPEGGIIDWPSGYNKNALYQWGGGIMMFEAKKLKEIDYFDEEFGIASAQDNDVIYRILMKGHKWRWTKNVVVRHFASISSTDPNAPDSRSERRRIGTEIFIKKHGFPPGEFLSRVIRHFKYD